MSRGDALLAAVEAGIVVVCLFLILANVRRTMAPPTIREETIDGDDQGGTD